VEAHRKEMRSRLEGVEKLARTVEALRGSLTEAKEGLTTCKAAAKERKALQDKIERHRDECTSLDSAKKTLERSLQRTSEKLAEFRPVAEVGGALCAAPRVQCPPAPSPPLPPCVARAYRWHARQPPGLPLALPTPGLALTGLVLCPP
jgi:phage shock protein A